MKHLTGIAAAFAALAIPVLAASPEDFTAVSSVRMTNTDPVGPGGSIPVEFTVSNTSAHKITAVYYTLTARFADGTQKVSHGGEDSVTSLAAEQMGDSGARVFRPGTSRTYEGHVYSSSTPPVAVTIKLVLVAFDDATAVGDPAEIRGLVAQRKGMLEEVAATASDLEEIRGAADPKARAAELAAALEKNGVTGIRRQILGVAAHMIGHPAFAGKDVVGGYAKVYAGLRDSLAAQTDLKEIR